MDQVDLQVAFQVPPALDTCPNPTAVPYVPIPHAPHPWICTVGNTSTEGTENAPITSSVCID
ncbi:hypothetical protein BDM02DRAFT_3119853 [Thelephora ganbajun]|uniref:Uncharacterized protein n=1 Tax=Thelephora ganbajun TaxID=370292 RepID=A0ACB6Z7W2_THEGA|nr:hypothetical protein BDM02DRAFT_3119853 [Thelephora ganbajun]